jgi:hypothetical protein
MKPPSTSQIALVVTVPGFASVLLSLACLVLAESGCIPVWAQPAVILAVLISIPLVLVSSIGGFLAALQLRVVLATRLAAMSMSLAGVCYLVWVVVSALEILRGFRIPVN